MKTSILKEHSAISDIRKSKHIIAHWLEAITNFYEYYHQLAICISQRGIENESVGGNIAYSGQYPMSQLVKLAGSMQTELADLTQAIDQIDPLKPSTTMYDQLISHTLRLNQINDQAQTMLELGADKKMILVEKIKGLIHQIVEDVAEPLKLKNSHYISQKLDYDYTYLSNIFSEVTGTTIEQYLIVQRIEKVKKLLLYDEQSLTQIACDLNYSSTAHLSSQFKKVTGLTPSFFKNLRSQYRKAQHNEIDHFDQLSQSFSWSLNDQQQQYYHRSLRRGYTLVLTNLEKTILWTSRSFWAMTGYKPIDVLGKTPYFLQGPGTNPITLRYIRKQLNEVQTTEADVVNYRSDGEHYVCHLQIESLRNKQGKATHFLAVEYAVN